MSSTLQILQGLYNIVGHETFNAALKEIRVERNGGGIQSVESARLNLDENAKKTRAKPVITNEEIARRSADMRGIQAFTQYVRTLMPPGTSYRDAQITAGTRWKALSAEEKGKWREPAATTCIVCSNTIENTDTHKECLKQYILRRFGEGISTDDAIQEFLQGLHEN